MLIVLVRTATSITWEKKFSRTTPNQFQITQHPGRDIVSSEFS